MQACWRIAEWCIELQTNCLYLIRRSHHSLTKTKKKENICCDRVHVSHVIQNIQLHALLYSDDNFKQQTFRSLFPFKLSTRCMYLLVTSNYIPTTICKLLLFRCFFSFFIILILDHENIAPDSSFFSSLFILLCFSLFCSFFFVSFSICSLNLN